MKKTTLIALLVLVCAASARADTIYDVATGNPISRKELLAQLANADTVVVGEKHYSPKVQSEEAQLLREWSALKREAVTFAWEFLNWSDRARVQPLYKKFTDGLIDSTGLVQAIFGTPTGDEVLYAPLFDELKANGGYLLETNLTRAEKAPVTTGGIGALDPSLLPPNFAVGSANYRERFDAAMAGHVDPSKLQNYFEAQSLVDDVAAYHIRHDTISKSLFLVIGSFHMVYGDGVVSRIGFRAPTRVPLTILVDETVDYPAKEVDRAAIFNHAKYGKIAHYVILKD